MNQAMTLKEVRDAGMHGSAWMAKSRLLYIVKVDRWAVPCGWWVRKSGPPTEFLKYWLSLGFERPRYRYEVRR